MTCTLTTDFGAADWYVGALKGTLLRLAPGISLVDLSHDIAPGDIAAASLVLAGAAPTFPPGTLHLAVVDPGVGSSRRLLAVHASGQIFLAPDNGLLTPFLTGGVVHAVDRRGSLPRRAGRDVPRARSIRADRRGALRRDAARPARPTHRRRGAARRATTHARRAARRHQRTRRPRRSLRQPGHRRSVGLGARRGGYRRRWGAPSWAASPPTMPSSSPESPR